MVSGNYLFCMLCLMDSDDLSYRQDMDDSSADVPGSTVANMMTKRQSTCPVSTNASSSSSSSPSKSKRKCTSKDEEGGFLPNDVISIILSHLPASFLYENCRLACRAWAKLLRCPNFVNSQLSRTLPPCLFIQKVQAKGKALKTKCVGIIEDWSNIQVRDMNLQSLGCIVSSSDGVVLIRNDFQCFIANPITRQVLKLPDTKHFSPSLCFNGIARIPNTGELKVVLHRKISNHFFIITAGDGKKWRRYKISTVIKPSRIRNHGTSVGGVVYSSVIDGGHCHCIFAVDLRDESGHQVMLPDGKHQTILSNRDSLYVIDVAMRNTGFWRVWLLKDLHRREWVRIQDLDISAMGLLEPLPKPLVWLESEQVMVVDTSRGCLKGWRDGPGRRSCSQKVVVGCCLRSGNYKILEENSDWPDVQLKVLWHTNSLVRF
ncbi:hypothetical protein Tsubulata_020237 [Turnera subulata]|uniref:F-box associated beta-propeller type 3 domain-containing protein n=1 Tax=Turnera subulata TaxID=218843 RepID=A0A9Q0JFE6_9ROSI|nr:hypothetical protein Tsubulata_020237 [Turnera subulata]